MYILQVWFLSLMQCMAVWLYENELFSGLCSPFAPLPRFLRYPLWLRFLARL